MYTSIGYHRAAIVSDVSITPENRNCLGFSFENKDGDNLISFSIFGLPKEITDILLPAFEAAAAISGEQE